MLQTSAWLEIDLKVLTEVHLDINNVRLENEGNQVEADLLNDLFANESVLPLVGNIVLVGFLTHELPIVVKRRNKYIVVEGNRRVAALKAIQNPMLVADYSARIKEATKGLTRAQLKNLGSVRVKVAPNQEQANELIAVLHTGQQRRAWSPARQAAFFQAQINAGRTYDELKRRYPTADVPKFVLRSRILGLFQSVSYDDPELNDYVKSNAWRRGSSTIERIYEARDFVELTDIAMDTTGGLTHGLTPQQLKDVATLIVTGMKAGDLNTRTINKVTSARFGKLMDDLRGVVESASGGGGGSGSGGAGGTSGAGGAGGASGAGGSGSGGAGGTSGTGGSGSAGAGAGSKGGTRPKTSRHLTINMTVPTNFTNAMQKSFGELTILDVHAMPNTAYLALRAILEKSIKQFAELEGETIPVSGGQGGYVQLHHALLWYENYVKANGPKHLLQPIQKVRTSHSMNWGSFAASKAAMDAANHNHHFLVGPTDVLELWDAIDPLMRELLKP